MLLLTALMLCPQAACAVNSEFRSRVLFGLPHDLVSRSTAAADAVALPGDVRAEPWTLLLDATVGKTAPAHVRAALPVLILPPFVSSSADARSSPAATRLSSQSSATTMGRSTQHALGGGDGGDVMDDAGFERANALPVGHESADGRVKVLTTIGKKLTAADEAEHVQIDHEFWAELQRRQQQTN